ncbi:hypothetical protein RRG08_050723 [Elysia crispata]|uniref:Uncharacterized protein n=1 Tax=Elysia crispata TaxID=231223 RepID=A0AAE1DMT8_9GAST|nr:hypothetical protein RRG08_050723 [Elysia crispata]
MQLRRRRWRSTTRKINSRLGEIITLLPAEKLTPCVATRGKNVAVKSIEILISAKNKLDFLNQRIKMSGMGREDPDLLHICNYS